MNVFIYWKESEIIQYHGYTISIHKWTSFVDITFVDITFVDITFVDITFVDMLRD